MESPSNHSPGFLRSQRLGLALTGLVLLLALVGLGVMLYRQSEQQGAEQAFIDTAGVKATSLQATNFGPGAQGTIYADPKAPRALLVVTGLAPLPPNRVYQLWLFQGNVPSSAGTFTVDAQGNARTFVNAPAPLETYQVCAITQEPEGGSATPTTGIALLCQF